MSHLTSHSQRLLWCHTDLTDLTESKSEGRGKMLAHGSYGSHRLFSRGNMTQDERWMARYNEVVTFIETNHRNPSKHRIEEHDYLNWLKANRKAMNAGKMKLDRVENFRKLLEMTEQYRRKNQYE